MKKIEINKLVQKNVEFYVAVLDPREVVELIEDVKAGEAQEAQRPWLEKKVIEIRDYVTGKVKISDDYTALGLIPNAPILATEGKLKITEETIKKEIHGKLVPVKAYFIHMPEGKEVEKYRGSILPIDGQHRIRAFDKKYRDPSFKDDIEYSMVFTIFNNLSKNQRRELFWVTNAKQDKVQSNLLRLIMHFLGLLGVSERAFEISKQLNDESFSPLKNRIMIGSEKINKGYKEAQISKILEKSGLLEKLIVITNDDNDAICKVYSNYLSAWEKAFGISFQNPTTSPLTKISGIRYISFMMSEIIEILQQEKKTFTIDNFYSAIKNLEESVGGNPFEDENMVLAFRGEGATTKMAKNHGIRLSQYVKTVESGYNPLKGL